MNDLLDAVYSFIPGAGPAVANPWETGELSLEDLEAGAMVRLVFWLLAKPLLYLAWKSKFIRCSAEGEVFVVDPSGGRISSESMAFGLLLAVQNNDYKLFNQLFKSLEQRMMVKGLPAAEGHLDEKNHFVLGAKDRDPKDVTINLYASAADGDIDVALALVQAFQKAENNETGWRLGKERYKERAQKMLDLIWKEDVVDGGGFTLLKGSNVAVGPAAELGADVNPSYFNPAAFEVFHRFDNESTHRWLDLKADCYRVLEVIVVQGAIERQAEKEGQKQWEQVHWWQQSPREKFVQMPDWVKVWYQHGAFQVEKMPVPKTYKDALKGYTSNQGYDAVRTFWKVAQDALWNKDAQAIQLARQLLDQLDERDLEDLRQLPIFSADTLRNQVRAQGAEAYSGAVFIAAEERSFLNQSGNDPKMIVLAAYAALARAAATALPGETRVPPQYLRWANKSANLFSLTYQTVGDQNGPYFASGQPGSKAGSTLYYDQTTAFFSALILGGDFQKVFEAPRPEWSRTAQKVIGDCDSFARLHFVCGPRVMLDPSEKQKLTAIVAQYLALEGEDPSTEENIHRRILLAESLVAFGYVTEGAEQYQIALSKAEFSRDYKWLLRAYLGMRGALKESTSAAAGVRIFEEIHAVNPANLFALLGRAQFQRELYSVDGYMQTVKLCNDLLREDLSAAPEIQMEAYRLRAEAYFGFYLWDSYEDQKGGGAEKASTISGWDAARADLEQAKRVPPHLLEEPALRESIFFSEARFYYDQAEKIYERAKNKNNAEEMAEAKEKYAGALEVYFKLLRLNNQLAADAPYDKKGAYGVAAQDILTRIIDVQAKLAVVEAEEIKLRSSGAENQWLYRAQALLLFFGTRTILKPEGESPADAEQMEKAFLLVQQSWEPTFLNQEATPKQVKAQNQWHRALQVKQVQLAKLSTPQQLAQAVEKFLSFAPLGGMRVHFEKALYYFVEGGDRERALRENGQAIETLEIIRACFGDSREVKKFLLTPEMNRALREVLDLVRDGQLEEAQKRADQPFFRLALDVYCAGSSSSWEEFLKMKEAYLSEGITGIEEFAGQALERDEMLKFFVEEGHMWDRGVREKIDLTLGYLRQMQHHMEVNDQPAAEKVIDEALKKLEKDYRELPYDPQLIADLTEVFPALIFAARENKMENLIPALLIAYLELTGLSFLIEEYWERQVDHFTGEQKQAAEALLRAASLARKMLRDKGLQNLLFTTFRQQVHIKGDALKTAAGNLEGVEDLVSRAVVAKLYEEALETDPENEELRDKAGDYRERAEREQKSGGQKQRKE